jgi:hypothetical protein
MTRHETNTNALRGGAFFSERVGGKRHHRLEVCDAYRDWPARGLPFPLAVSHICQRVVLSYRVVDVS